MTRFLYNDTRYLAPSIVNDCFALSKTIHVDKVVCGNGFSTAFLNLQPTPGTINILIAPNRAVIIDKEKQHIVKSQVQDTIATKFFYKGSEHYNFDDADILCFVADSFLQYQASIEKIADKINYILIDEYHSTVIQSAFRSKLVNLVNKVRNIVGESPALTTVTATPLYYSNIDIRIKEKVTSDSFITPFNINLTNDEVNAIQSIKKLLQANENVIVATNSKKVIYNLRDENNTLEADFVIGERLMSSTVELVKVKQNDRSNLKVISGKGFEGFDVYGEDYNVFFFEDRSQDYTTFYLANLYQAINRARDGVKYVEYIRLDLDKKRKLPFQNIDRAVTRFVKRNDISIHQKQATDFNHYKPFIILDQSKDGVFRLSKNEDGIKLFKESVLYDNRNISKHFKPFLDDRKITLTDKRDINNRLPRVQVATTTKKTNLYINRILIGKLGLFNDEYFMPVLSTDKVDVALVNVKTYLRRKNYDGKYERKDTHFLVLDYLTNDKLFTGVLNELTRRYNEASVKKYGIAKSKERRDRFKNKANRVLIEMLQIFVNDNLYIKRKEIANRDYNVLVDVGFDELKFIGSLLTVDVEEIDIRNCFPRILYAINGLELPADFYGVDKKNKYKINVLLNDFMLNVKAKSSISTQKKNAIRNLKNVGIDDKVIAYLMSNFFESKHRGDLFNFLSFHEKKIIKKLKNHLLERNYKGLTRRHDSLIMFDQSIEKATLNDFEYMNQYGWFFEHTTSQKSKVLVEVDHEVF